MARLIIGNKYLIDDRGDVVEAEYMGREGGFECCVCGKGCKAHCFNVYHSDNAGDYETWGFGDNHMPKILKAI